MSITTAPADLIATLPTDLADATPPQIDHVIANLAAALATHGTDITRALDGLRYVDGQRKDYRYGGKHGSWELTAHETLRSIATKLSAGTIQPWDVDGTKRDLARHATASRAAVVVREQIRGLEMEHSNRGWTRFFLVPSGHIHSSQACKTCRPTTQIGWLPDLSGLTEADAVAAHGPLLCTVCFPSAPLAWTSGPEVVVDPNTCTGLWPVAGTVKRYGGGNGYGTCQGCETSQSVTTTGKVRKHKRPAA